MQPSDLAALARLRTWDRTMDPRCFEAISRRNALTFAPSNGCDGIFWPCTIPWFANNPACSGTLGGLLGRSHTSLRRIARPVLRIAPAARDAAEFGQAFGE